MLYSKLRSIFIDNIVFSDYYKSHDLKLRWPIFLSGIQNLGGEKIIPLLNKLMITPGNEIAGYIDFPGKTGWYVLNPKSKSKGSLLYFKLYKDDIKLWNAIIDMVICTLKRDWENCHSIVSLLDEYKIQ